MTKKKDDFAIFNAKPTVENDKSKIKWPKRKLKLVRSRTEMRMVISKHPGTKDARTILRQNNRDLHSCENCGSTYRINIHHKNHNPYDNHIENLSVLCSDCHWKLHHSNLCVCAEP